MDKTSSVRPTGTVVWGAGALSLAAPVPQLLKTECNARPVLGQFLAFPNPLIARQRKSTAKTKHR